MFILLCATVQVPGGCKSDVRTSGGRSGLPIILHTYSNNITLNTRVYSYVKFYRYPSTHMLT